MGNPVAICMDFTGSSYTEEVARSGCISGTYSAGGCSSAGAIGKCANYANDPSMASLVMSTYYYGKDAKMAEVMSSACAQTGIWTALRSSAAPSSPAAPAKRQVAAQSTTSQHSKTGRPSPPTDGLCRPMQSVTNQGEPIGEPFWQCPPGVKPPGTPPAATPGESPSPANGYSMVNGTCVGQNGRPSIDPSMCKRGNVAATSGANYSQSKPYRSSGSNGKDGRVIANVSGSGDSEYCYSEHQARSNAEAEAENIAREKCLNMNGHFGSKFENGHVSIKACGGGERGNYRIKVFDAIFSCYVPR